MALSIFNDITNDRRRVFQARRFTPAGRVLRDQIPICGLQSEQTLVSILI